MPLYDPPTAYDDELTAQSDALARRKALLTEQLKQQIAQQGYYAPYKPDNTEVGGFTLSTQTPGMPGVRIPGRIVSSPFGQVAQGLAPLVASARLDNQTQQFDTDQAVFNRAAREDAMRRLTAMPQGTPATEGTPEVPSQYAYGQTSPAVPAVPAQPAKDAPLADTIRWAASLQDNPRTQALGGKILENTLVTLPGKRSEQLLEYLKLVETSRHNTVMEGKPIAVPDVGLFERDPANPTGYRMVVAAPGKPLPEGPAKDFRNANATMSSLNALVAALDTPEGKGATGPFIGALSAIPGIGPAAANLFNPEGRATRALVTGITAMKVHDITGAAYGLAEFDRLRPYIPQVGDDYATVRDKVANLQRETALVQEEISKQAADQKYRSPGVRVQPRKPLEPNKNGPNPPVEVVLPGESSPGKPPMPGVGAVEGGHRFKGGNPADPSNWVRVQ